MTQACSLRARYPRRRIGKGEQLYKILAIHREVEFIGLSLCSVYFPDDGETKYLCIEFLRPLIVGADDGYVMEGLEEHGVHFFSVKITDDSMKHIVLWRRHQPLVKRNEIKLYDYL